VYAGSTVPSLKKLADEGVGQILSWQLLFAFAILGLLPLALKRIFSLLNRNPDNREPPTEESVEASTITESQA
jgi:hypothetical protein